MRAEAARPVDPSRAPRTRSLAIALAAGLAAIFLARGGVWHHVGGRDTHALFVSLYEAAGRALLELRLPLWNPYEFFGTPLLGSGQGGMLYPPIAVAFALLPPRWALQAVYVVHLALFVVAAMRYAERHAIAPSAAPLVPLLGLAGLFTSLGYGGIDHPSFLCELAWLPVLLLAIDRARDGDAARAVALLAIASAAQWLAGYPDFAFNGTVLVTLAAVLAPPPPAWTRRLLVVAAGLALGAALAAPQILALRETVLESVRTEHLHNYAVFRERALRVTSLADLERGPLKSAFLPAVVLGAAALARLDRDRLFWLVALAWCALPLNPPFALLYALPPFSGSRIPVAWGATGGTFLGLLAAAGLTAALARRGVLRSAAVALALGVAAHALWVFGRAPTLLRGEAPDYARLADRAAIVRDVASHIDPQPRFLGAIDVDGGAPLRHALRSPTGYEPAVPPRRPVALLKPLGLHESAGWGRWPLLARDPDLAALAGIGLVAAEPAGVPALEGAGFRRLRDLPGGDALLYREPLPRARLVRGADVVADELASLRTVLAGAGRARDRVVLEGPEGAAAAARIAPPPPGARESATIREDEAERVVVEVVTASDAFLVLADSWAPGWRATIDGAPATLLRADHAFRAVAVPAGEHVVAFDYRPGWLAPALTSSVFAAAVIVALLVAGRHTRAAPQRAAARS